MTIYWFTFVIIALYILNAIWLVWHGDWAFAWYWLSAASISVASYVLASR